MSMTIKIVTTGNFRTGVAAKSGKPYTMAEAYAHLPGVPFPQKFSYYCTQPSEVLAAGEYEADLILGIKDERITVEVDPRQARKLPAPAARQTA
ncbi:propanediol utilization protein [Phytopseudomonas daroniae]|uniref:propanediol utilization protein n=1 Tax=Phytopseudomonas daroniae TaxID=2487519 RepID=UPI0010384E38|nr:propanediol utilization protein [Pseudomonas daroniae]TBU73714.1 propanediol utilization protein [Pseudomonas daroniae]